MQLQKLSLNHTQSIDINVKAQLQNCIQSINKTSKHTCKR